MKKRLVEAVHDDDLRTFLNSLGLLDRILNGEFACLHCSDKITLDNLSAVFPCEGNICLACSKFECLNAMQQLVDAQGGPTPHGYLA